MTTPTLKQWQRRALKAEAELELIQQCRKLERDMEINTWRELAMHKVALKEIRDALEFLEAAQ